MSKKDPRYTKRVKIVFYGAPEVASVLGGSTVDLLVEGDTLSDLFSTIRATYGIELGNALNLHVIRNGRSLMQVDLACALEDRDIYTFIVPVAIAGG
jgi:hypothetical protein